MTDPRTRAEKLAAMAASTSPREAEIAHRKLAELIAREGAGLSRATVYRTARGMSAAARAALIAEYERWSRDPLAGGHTREWRA